MFKNGKYSAERAAAAWNSKLAGKRALTAVRKDGYQCGSVLGVNILAHRAIFAIVHGFYPPEIDHVQGVEAGNVIGNLREATSLTNSQNQKRRRDNTSGTTGVHFSRRSGRWVAKIKVNYRAIHLGEFSSKDDAVRARREAERVFGFHPNHGRPPVVRAKAEQPEMEGI